MTFHVAAAGQRSLLFRQRGQGTKDRQHSKRIPAGSVEPRAEILARMRALECVCVCVCGVIGWVA